SLPFRLPRSPLLLSRQSPADLLARMDRAPKRTSPVAGWSVTVGARWKVSPPNSLPEPCPDSANRGFYRLRVSEDTSAAPGEFTWPPCGSARCTDGLFPRESYEY